MHLESLSLLGSTAGTWPPQASATNIDIVCTRELVLD